MASLLLTVLWLAQLAAASLTISIPPSTLLPNPQVLPATTHATLTTLSADSDHRLTASLTHASTLVFPDLPTGQPASYLLDIRSGEYVFAPYRVDVAADGTVLGIWETFRGNAWDNRGAEKYVVDVASKKSVDVVVEAKAIARKSFYEERAKFSPLSLFKNPMILMAVVALGLTFGMPKLMENSTSPPPDILSCLLITQRLTPFSVDPEMRAEFEQQSRASPLSGATTNAMAGGGFDLAGWMAGTSPNVAKTDQAPGGATGREAGSARRRG
ncbi:hypothetical protein N7462_000276 [Penicillium macrosclerotiorum]|uniref:uncharacterized protein n=1 Tax=Penicillium macrosclerotiorum TaxID=303699 RepID=UPI002549562E|nr:uncharacterized protein N7462_000276 [Penicillium macrosclerotiorum]KAJ5698271.1 hypothetical protein N7462_000276 [Penicillium macrosclerotiorum]